MLAIVHLSYDFTYIWRPFHDIATEWPSKTSFHFKKEHRIPYYYSQIKERLTNIQNPIKFNIRKLNLSLVNEKVEYKSTNNNESQQFIIKLQIYKNIRNDRVSVMS